MDSFDDFRHLWDGSEPGWRLYRVDHMLWRAAFRFGDNGPSIREIAAVRNCLDELRDTPMQAVWGLLRGIRRYELPNRLGNIEAERLQRRALELRLTLDLSAEDAGGYLPISPDGGALVIDDDALAKEIIARMLQAGVPVGELGVD